MCSSDLVHAWRADRLRWQQQLQKLPTAQLRSLPPLERRRQALGLLSRPGSARLTWHLGGLGAAGLAERPVQREPLRLTFGVPG